jgi:HEAT repeat protein
MDIEDPSPGMDKMFYETLSAERKETVTTGKIFRKNDLFQSNSLNTFLKIAAGIALFIIGWFSGTLNNRTDNKIAELSYEVRGLKESLVLTMLNQSSSFDRIKALSMVSEFEHADERIIGSLLNALNNDTNDNVRLLALEALLKYSDNPLVRQGLVESISKQSSPIIQVRLSEVMVALDEKEAVPEFRKVLMDAGLNYNVRRAMDHAVTVLL